MRADAEVQNAENLLRQVIDLIPALAWSGRPDGSADYFNRGWHDYTGLSVEQAVDWGWAAALHPDDINALVLYWKSILVAGEPGEIEARLRRFDGEYRWFLFRAKPERDGTGKIIKWYGTYTDIEDRKRAEQALRTSELNFRLIVDTIPALVCLMTPAGEVELANQQILDYFGKTREELKSWASIGAVHEEDLAAVIAQWRYSTETGQPYDMEHRIRRAEGVYRWFHVRGLPLRDGEGHILRWYILLTDIEDRKRAEEAVRASEAHLRLITETIPALLWRATPEGQMDYVNRRVLEYTGLSLEDLRQAGWNPLLHPDDAEHAAQLWRGDCQAGNAHELTYRLRRADGEYRWFQVRGEPLLDNKGRVLSWYGVLSDIDDRKRAEDALRESERQLLQFLDTIPALVWRGTAQGTLGYLNQRFVNYTGQTLENLAGGRWMDLVDPNHVAGTVSRWLQSVRSGTSYDDVYRLRRADGEFRWIQSVGEPFYDQEGRIAHWYGLVIDIDDRKRAEQALRESEDHLRTLVETIPAIVSRSTSEGKLDYVNQRGWDYLGDTLGLIGHYGFPFTHPDDLDAASQRFLSCLKTGEPYENTYRLRRADGVYRWFYVRVEPLRDQQGRVASWYAIHIDIDDSKQMEEALRSTQRKLSAAMQIATVAELSASIAHEINQPLAAIMANSQACQTWLASDPPNLERARLTAERITRDASSAAQVVRRIRGLFKQAPPAKTSLSVNEVVAETLSLLADEIRANAIVVDTNLEQGLPVVLADRVQIQQAILNLVHNAIEAMEAGNNRSKALLLRSQRDGANGIAVQIRDHGPGIENPEAIFDPFFTTKQYGMGMGLAICRSIIEAHGGRLWATRNQDAGSTFTFTLPVEPEIAR